MTFDVTKLQWLREPADCAISPDRIEIVTKPHTDLWQRTYTNMEITQCKWLPHDGQQPDPA